jgi:hypothetical protein
LPYIPDFDVYPGYDIDNYPQDELDVSPLDITPNNDIPFPIEQNIATERVLTFSEGGRVYRDTRQISLVNGSGRRVVDPTQGTIVEGSGRRSGGGIRFVDPIDVPVNPVGNSCGDCAGLYTSLNLSALGNALTQLMRPILSQFNNKNTIVRNSWPHVDFTIVAVTLNGVSISSSRGGRINIQLAVTATGKLHVRTKLLGSATTTFNIVNYNISAGATLSKNSSSKLSLSNVSVTAGYNDLNIHTSGGLIMKFIIKVASTLLKVKSLCRNILTDSVPAALQTALANIGVNTVNTLPWKIKVGKWGAGINMAIANVDTNVSNTLIVGFNAETINFNSGLPYPGQSHPQRHQLTLQPNPAHLFSILMDSFTLNDYVMTWFTQNNSEKTTLYNKTTRPQWLTDLDTMAWNLIFPGIGHQYPHSNLVMKIELTSEPKIDINGGIATLSASAQATWAIDNGMGQIGSPLVAIKLNLSTGLAMSMKYDSINRLYALIPTITNITPQFETVQTFIGPIEMGKVNATLNNIINYVIVPLIDLVLLDGIPIPSTANFQLTSPTIGFVNNAVLVGAGVSIQF